MDKHLSDVIPFAKKYIGSPYVLGALVPKKIPGYKGAFDCAEFVAYCIGQVFGIFNYGVREGDAYTGFFNSDAKMKGIIIPVEKAARIAGAILLRVAADGAIGHVVFSQGNGKTVEAHSTKYGVIENKVDGRRWDYGILLPGIPFGAVDLVETKAPAIVYKLKEPLMRDPFVEKLQAALKAKGYYNFGIDPYFGKNTLKAVIDFQRAFGLVVDGEVTPDGETAEALGI